MTSPRISRVVPKLARNTINTIAKRFQTEKSLPITIQDLPDEIFDIVFQHVFTLHKTPFLIRQVSTRWRRLVLANPHLWTCIRIEERDHPGSLYSQSPDFLRPFTDGSREPGADPTLRGRYHICRDDKQLLDSLRRAGSLPIEVSYWSELGPLTHNPCLEMILKAPISHRIEALSIRFGYWRRVSLIEQPDQLSFPTLRRLDLFAENGNWPINFLQCLSRGISLLTHLTLNIQARLDDSVINLRIWSRLIEFRSSSEAWPTFDFRPDPEILVNVPKLCLGCTSRQLYLLNLQNLQTLYYRNLLSQSNLSLREQISLPQLTTLTLETKYSFKGIVWWKMPRLLSIRIIYQSQEPSRDGLMSTTFPTVTDFYMETAEENTTLLPVFEFVPNVHRLSFIQHRHPPFRYGISHYFDETIRLHEAGVCPELRMLTLGDSENVIRPPDGRRTPIPQLVERILKARRKKVMSMIEFYIYWDKSGRGLTELCRYSS